MAKLTKPVKAVEDSENTPEKIYDPTSQLKDFMKANKTGHFNDEPDYDYFVSSGSLNLDIAMRGGMRPGIIRMTGTSEGGKMQPLWSKILTPTGWVTMGDIKVGDSVVGSDGNPKKVLTLHPQGKLDYYKVSFSDGTSTHCGDEHLWKTQTARDRQSRTANSGSVKTTKEIRESLVYCGHTNHSVDYVSPVNFIQTKELLISPYVLGCFIGDGCLRTQTSLTFNDDEIRDRCNMELRPIGYFLNKINAANKSKKAYSVTKINETERKRFHSEQVLIDELKRLGLYNHYSYEKFIPKDYLYATVENRISLLQGLMDCDGYPKRKTKHASSQYCTTSELLANNVIELARSLGAKVTFRTKIPTFTHKGVKKNGRKCWIITMSFSNGINPFHLSRKASLVLNATKKTKKYITNVELAGNDECQCITIDSEDHLYVTDDFILTHNSSASLAFITNFLKTVPNSRAVVIPSEGKRLENLIKNRGNLKFTVKPEEWENGTCFVYRTNIYENAITLIRDLIENNPTNTRYVFLIDSMDALVPKNDFSKSFEESTKVAGGAVLSSDFLKRMALMISARGHIVFMISQVRADVKIDKYAAVEKKLTNASGSNALVHYADWILEFKHHLNQDDWIWAGEAGKSDRLGHFCEIIFRKTPIERTGKVVKYPIKYSNSGQGAIWSSYEICDTLLMWGLAKSSGAWVYMGESILKEMKDAGFEVPEKINGIAKMRAFFDENQEATSYLVNKFKNALSV
jgi:Homing endonuclease/recA bacterial DNA recombination protein